MIRAWVDDYNTERPHSSLGYANPAAFTAEIEEQPPGRVQAVASGALAHHNTADLWSRLDESRGSRHLQLPSSRSESSE